MVFVPRVMPDAGSESIAGVRIWALAAAMSDSKRNRRPERTAARRAVWVRIDTSTIFLVPYFKDEIQRSRAEEIGAVTLLSVFLKTVLLQFFVAASLSRSSF